MYPTVDDVLEQLMRPGSRLQLMANRFELGPRAFAELLQQWIGTSSFRLEYLRPGRSGCEVVVVARPGMTARVIKCGPEEKILLEASAFDAYVSERFAQFFSRVGGQAFVKDGYSSIAYTWASGFGSVETLYDAFATQAPEDLCLALSNLSETLFKWHELRTPAQARLIDGFPWTKGSKDRIRSIVTSDFPAYKETIINFLDEELLEHLRTPVVHQHGSSGRCHGDLNPGNVLIQANSSHPPTPHLIDWADIKIDQCPAYDWAKLERDIKIFCLRSFSSLDDYPSKLQIVEDYMGLPDSELPPLGFERRCAMLCGSIRKFYLKAAAPFSDAPVPEYLYYLSCWAVVLLLDPRFNREQPVIQEKWVQTIQCTILNLYHALKQSNAGLAAIFSYRAAEPLRAGRKELTPQHLSVGKLPSVGPMLIGRRRELRQLDNAWSRGVFHLVAIIAPGGVGKSALVAHWWRQNRAHDAAMILFESFYSQGSRDDAQASAEPFMDRIFRNWFKVENPPKDSWGKGERLAELIRRDRILLILDGLEPLQRPDGQMKEPGMTALIKGLAADNPGLCICTSRLPLTDLEIYGRDGVLIIDLDNLTPANGATYLKKLGVGGIDEERRQTSREFGNHALALTLLGQYLVAICDGDVRKRDTIPTLFVEPRKGGHARRIMRQYEALFKDKPELAILRMLSLFDRPADRSAIDVLRTLWSFNLTETKWNFAVKCLRDARLVDHPKEGGSLDCHPLIREHFAEEFSRSDFGAFRQAHSTLYEHYLKQSPLQPESLADMTPLFYAVYHGCKAGQYLEVREKICLARLLRYNESFILKNLGAFGAYLSVIANFFETRWNQPMLDLSVTDRIWAIGEAAFCLRGLGRLSEALKPMELAATSSEKIHDCKTACIRYRNLIRIQLLLGQFERALESGAKCIDFADQSCDLFQEIAGRAALAHAHHQSGNLDQAKELFIQAEKRQIHHQSERPFLYSVLGYFYCDFLLDCGNSFDATRRAKQTIKIALKHGWPLQVALDHLTLGRGHIAGSPEASAHLDEGIKGLRLSGQVDYLPGGLLARAASLRQIGSFKYAQKDLDEVFILATRCGMRLYTIDYHLEQARLFIGQSQPQRSSAHVAEARKLIAEVGYHRRDAELKDLEMQLGTTNRGKHPT